jgi:hypothetical protein
VCGIGETDRTRVASPASVTQAGEIGLEHRHVEIRQVDRVDVKERARDRDRLAGLLAGRQVAGELPVDGDDLAITIGLSHDHQIAADRVDAEAR